jgi:2-keto-4-pentenoate hydratase/2-oxohepta-3-ene-1,7-dioic acid hydratase in catechol pathway
MKLLRYGPPGKEKPGLVDANGKIRSLHKKIKDLTPDVLAPASLAKLRKFRPESLPLVPGKPRLGVPLTGVGKIVAVGLNYSDHAKEAGVAVPPEPVLFMKAITSLNGPNDKVKLPRDSVKGDWEIELGIVIGRKAQYVSEEDALRYVAGFCIVNDVSEREFQLEKAGQWTKGKSADTFCPVGPWLVTTDEIKDPQNLKMKLTVNGETRQNGSTATMIFGVKFLVSYISRFMTLMPGDVIPTGTPPGVGLGMKPTPVFLKPGDVMELTIDGLGSQRQQVVGP